MTELNIRQNKIGDNGIACIATALWANTTMRTLTISCCDISDLGAELLATALAVNSSLEDLFINDNKIGDSVNSSHCSTALQTNTTMKELELSKCDISDVGAESLARALAQQLTGSPVYQRQQDWEEQWQCELIPLSTTLVVKYLP